MMNEDGDSTLIFFCENFTDISSSWEVICDILVSLVEDLAQKSLVVGEVVTVELALPDTEYLPPMVDAWELFLL